MASGLHSRYKRAISIGKCRLHVCGHNELMARIRKPQLKAFSKGREPMRFAKLTTLIALSALLLLSLSAFADSFTTYAQPTPGGFYVTHTTNSVSYTHLRAH